MVSRHDRILSRSAPSSDRGGREHVPAGVGGGRSALSENNPPRPNEVTVIHAAPGTARTKDSKRSWAQQMFNFPDAKAPPPRERDDLSFLPIIPPLPAEKRNGDITGSVPEPSGDKNEKAKGEGGTANKEAADNKHAADKQAGDKQTAGKDGATKEPKDPPPSPNGTVVPVNATPNPSPSAAERALLERLQERRQELEKRARELDIREGLIADAEKRVESKLMQIKEGQQQLAVAAQKKEEAEAGRFKSLVTMYETMKPRDAAKIFDRLEVNVLLHRLDDEPALDVGSPRAHDARPGRAAHCRACEPRARFAQGSRRQPAEDRRPPDRTMTPAS
jgi:flagellar motility protein MotE (MotC chaperone)